MTLFSDSHQLFRAGVRAFVEERITPSAENWERAGEFPRALFLELADKDLLGVGCSSRYGGKELDFAHDIIIAEELTRCKATGIVVSIMAHNHFFVPLLSMYGTEEQKREFLVPAIRGEKVGAVASTEITGGTDVVNALECTAEEDGEAWVISGEKKFITNGPIADFVVTLVRTRPQKTTTSLSLVIVPTDTPGFEVRERLRTLGLHTSPTGLLRYNGCRVSKRFTLGKPNLGFFYAGQIFLIERLVASASAIALASLALEDTISYVRHRIVFGQPLSQLQAVRHRISEMATELEIARRFTYSVCEAYRDGVVQAKEMCMAKLHVGEMVQRVIHQCLQLHGGYGFLEDNWLTRAYRDVRFLTIGGGATEAMKDLVASYLRV